MHLFQDVKFALRSLSKRPLATTVIVVTLALAIGANTIMFSVVDASLLSDFAFHDPNRLVAIWNRYDRSEAHSSPPDYIDRRDQSDRLASIAAIAQSEMNLAGPGDPERVRVGRVTASFFDVLGVDTWPGPVRFPQEESPEIERVAVLSHALWQGRFGGRGDVVGETLRLDGESFRIVGAVSSALDFPRNTDLWIPLQFTPEQLSDDFRGNEYLEVIGRLKPGVDIAELRAEMDVIAARVIENVPDRAAFLTRNRWGASVNPLVDELVGDYRLVLLVLWASVALVLLVACANVSNLLLAMASARASELSLRAALGASRTRLARQLLTEAGLLALAGAAGGLALAFVCVPLLPRWIPHDLPQLELLSIDLRVAGFTAGIAVLTAMLFGLVPAFRAAHLSLSQRGVRRVGGALVVAEVAVTVVLLVAAGLVLKSYRALSAVELGFRAERTASVRVTLPRSSYPDPEARAAFARALVERVRSLPGVRSAAISYRVPLDSERWTRTFYPERYTSSPGEPAPGAQFNVVGPDYFTTLGIPLARGREFTATDVVDAPGVAIVDETTATRFWPDGSAVGARINLNGPRRAPDFREIVGIVGNVTNDALDETSRMQIYLPYAQAPTSGVSVSFTGDADMLGLAGAVRRETQAIDPDLPLHAVRGVNQLVADAVALPRFNTATLGGFALVALFLSALGIYGISSYSVATRTSEIGIRMALGARAANVTKLIVGEGLALVAVGLVAGWIGALALTRLMANILVDVEPHDSSTFAIISMVTVAVSTVATAIPARRAATVDPIRALRSD